MKKALIAVAVLVLIIAGLQMTGQNKPQDVSETPTQVISTPATEPAETPKPEETPAALTTPEPTDEPAAAPDEPAQTQEPPATEPTPAPEVTSAGSVEIPVPSEPVADGKPKTGGVLRWHEIENPPNLDPHMATDTTSA
ncbi:MAG: hypothetical protein LBT23_03510, partial [Synergistaceae bacterium]|nr:hypothetical protein [Synergistaceae bacterium]